MSDSFLTGSLIGTLVGLGISPLVRGAVVLREWRQARREVEVTDALIERMTPARRKQVAARPEAPPRGRREPATGQPGMAFGRQNLSAGGPGQR